MRQFPIPAFIFALFYASAAIAIQPVSPQTLTPDFSLPDRSGKKFSLKHWKGKIVILNFWASWCPPCLEETTIFINLQKQLADMGVQFVGIAVENRKNAETFLSKLEVNYPILIGDFEGIELSKAFGNHSGSVPFSAIIDPEGEIVYRLSGPISEKKLKSLLDSLIRKTTEKRS